MLRMSVDSFCCCLRRSRAGVRDFLLAFESTPLRDPALGKNESKMADLGRGDLFSVKERK